MAAPRYRLHFHFQKYFEQHYKERQDLFELCHPKIVKYRQKMLDR